jgi:type I restriction enzyme, R subunit
MKTIMESVNFEILRSGWPALASLGGFAEQYCHTDPNGALIKLRSFAEQMVEAIYQVHGFQKPYQANLNDLLNEACFRQVTPIAVLDKFHAIRIKSNKSVHGATETANTSLTMLREAYDFGRWFYLTFGRGAVADCPDYQAPSPLDTNAQIRQEKKAAIQKLAKYGSIEIDRLYEPPFTTVDSNGLDGVFSAEAEIDELIDILDTFSPPRPGPVIHNA